MRSICGGGRAAFLGSAFAALVLSGCASASVRFYTLGSTATPGSEPALQDKVLVGPVTVPSSVDRPQFVVQVESNRVDIDEFHIWAAPLAESIARTVAGDLTTLLGDHNVVVAPAANFAANWRVGIDVQRFDSIPGDHVAIDAVWSVTPAAAPAKARTGRTQAEEKVAGADYAAIAAAHSRALASVSRDIALAIRAGTKTK
ncbi:MAG TPA: PqiC family protein [Candidatus Binatia bacterium]|jgi:hypothetical protein